MSENRIEQKVAKKEEDIQPDAMGPIDQKK